MAVWTCLVVEVVVEVEIIRRYPLQYAITVLGALLTEYRHGIQLVLNDFQLSFVTLSPYNVPRVENLLAASFISIVPLFTRYILLYYIVVQSSILVNICSEREMHLAK